MARSAIVLLLLGLVATTVAAPITATGPVVDLGYGRYRGSYNATTGLSAFYGIPFAEPPVGALRWKAPRPMSRNENSSRIVDATAPGNICVQGYPYWISPNTTIPDGFEDCLVLNVLQPANATENSKLPVLITIHGGGYTLGNAENGDAHALLRHSNNPFVFVSLQYRLSAYGFLGSKKFEKDGGAPNVGLLDQRLAIEWVQEHICTFGGDPKKVTINGGSAGGGSVTSQMIMHGGVEDPPFHGAIAEYPWWQQNLRDEQLQQQYEYLLEAAQCSDLVCLQGLSEEVLAAATQATYAKGYKEGSYGYGSFYYGPYVDGKVIQDLPSREFKAGHYTKIPTLVDHDGYEGASFTNFSLTTFREETSDLKIQFPYADNDFVKGLFELYPSSDFNATFWQRAAWFGDFSIQCPTYYVASSLSSLNIPVYKMVFNAGSQVHAATGPFLNDWSPALPNPGYNATLAEMMQDWFVSFVLHQNPNAQAWSSVPKPYWPAYEEASRVMSVNYTQTGAVNDIYYEKDEQCRFFWRNGAIVQN